MPDFDFDAFNHDTPYEGGDDSGATIQPTTATEETPAETANSVTAIVEEAIEPQAEAIKPAVLDNAEPLDNGSSVEVDKW
jgi:hypothetical protein